MKGKKGFQKGHKPYSEKGRFPKGLIPWNKGEKISKPVWNKGLKYTPEQKKRLNLSGLAKGQGLLKGKKNPHSKGEKNFNWKGGISIGENKRQYNLENRLKRRKREYLAEGFHTNGEWETLKIQYNFTCPCCKRSEPEIKLTIDHIIPLVKGGSDRIENIQPLCRSCNSKKHDKAIKY